MKHMRLTSLIWWLALVSLVGCNTSGHYNRDSLALFGTAAGAGIGAAFSNGNSSTAENALIGGVVGGLTGAAVGENLDEFEARNQALFEHHLGRQLVGAVTMNDVLALTRAGVSDEVICTHITRNRPARPLTTQDLIMLQENGVSNVVIQALQIPPVQPVIPETHAPVIFKEHHYVRLPLGWFGHHHQEGCYGRWPDFRWGVSFSN